jgi:hypothetical protein
VAFTVSIQYAYCTVQYCMVEVDRAAAGGDSDSKTEPAQARLYASKLTRGALVQVGPTKVTGLQPSTRQPYTSCNRLWPSLNLNTVSAHPVCGELTN